MSRLFIGGTPRAKSAPVAGPRKEAKEPAPPPSLKGKTAFLSVDGQRVVVFVKEAHTDARYEVELTLPDSGGMLHKTGSCIVVDAAELNEGENLALSPDDYRVKEWSSQVEIEVKSPTPVTDKDKGRVVDYENVTITGYLSTFANTTPRDRDGDYVMDGAFKNTLADFARNPVLLIDHRNACDNLAGSFTKMGTNSQGLTFEAKISNAPGLCDLRFKVAEGHLKATSMGGIFFYDDDGRGIKEVKLFEGSLVPVPANQDALFSVRSLTAVTAAKQFKKFEASGKSYASK
jgi:HK97 family phage prohead protease